MLSHGMPFREAGCYQVSREELLAAWNKRKKKKKPPSWFLFFPLTFPYATKLPL